MDLASPINGRPLRPDGPHSLTDTERRYPCIEGIPFLRSGRDALRERALACLDDGDEVGALVALLADQDDFAPMAPANDAALRTLLAEVANGPCSLRRAMDLLAFEHVGTYFAHRWSTPTFLSALGLIDRFWTAPAVFVEIGCGIGQILREVGRHGSALMGVDVVFAKLWLARRFVVPQAALICADAETSIPIGAAPGSTVLCHDAFYFLRHKAEILREMRRVAGPEGSVLIGHAHNVRRDHGIAGTPLDPESYASLAADAVLFDDADLAAEALGQGTASAKAASELSEVEAISMAIGPERRGRGSIVAVPIEGSRLRLNPLLDDDGTGRLAPRWPDQRFALEYGELAYLRAAKPAPGVLAAANKGEWNEEIALLAQQRILLDLPELW